MKDIYSDYLKFVKNALKIATKIPKYFSKFSNKIYCNYQKCAIYLFMQKLKTTARGVISLIKASSEIQMLLELKRIPVHTTIIRFGKKIEKRIDRLLDIRQANNVAVDSTGFETESKSYYFRNIQNSDKPQKTKRYVKLSVCVDTDKLFILKYKIRRKLRNDHIDFKKVLQNIETKKVFADKGYDSKKNRQFVLNKLRAIPIIPVRGHNNFYGYLKLGKKVDGRDYHQRSKVETVFSMIKRKYGSVLRNKTFATQKVELISKLIAHNIDRMQYYFLFLSRGLHQSPKIRLRFINASHLR